MNPNTQKSLAARLIRRLLVSHVLLAACLFVPAGSLRFWQGWSYLVSGLIASTCSMFYFYRRDPQVVERRLLKKEKVSGQKIIHTAWKMLVVVFLVLAGYDHRFGWSSQVLAPIPWWLTVAALLLILAGDAWIFQVLQANRFAASVIQVEAKQTVIDTGPYRWVRHPMYFGSLLIWLGSPLALGSFVAVPVSFLILPTLVFRLRSEEAVLRRELPGYVEYCDRTRYRLIPFVW